MRKLSLTALLAAAAVAVAAAPAGAASAGARAPAGSSWQIAVKVAGPGFPSFTAVTAASATSAWTFETAGTAAPRAYQLSGSTWTAQPFPDPAGDSVSSASSSSSDNVWAFTFQGRVLHYDGTSWTIVKNFGKVIESGLAISSSDVWVFGQSFAPALGTWRYNGSTWTKVSSGAGLGHASALSANSVWACGGTDVAHWNGSTWKKTSVAHLLPKNTELSHSFVADVYAASSKSVYAVASGGRQDEGGPLVLLHYNGSTWRRLALNAKLGGPVAVVPDGSGGLWIPVVIGQGISSMEHYAGGVLKSVSLPYAPPHLSLSAAANARNSHAALTVGFYRKSFSATTSTAVILRYGG